MSSVQQWHTSYHQTEVHTFFFELLVGQMEATLEGQDVNVCIKTGKLINRKIKPWPDYLADDFIHHPQHQDFEHMSFYEMTRCYKKVFKPLHRESKEDI
jgi:hypothetical protein